MLRNPSLDPSGDTQAEGAEPARLWSPAPSSTHLPAGYARCLIPYEQSALWGRLSQDEKEPDSASIAVLDPSTVFNLPRPQPHCTASAGELSPLLVARLCGVTIPSSVLRSFSVLPGEKKHHGATRLSCGLSSILSCTCWRLRFFGHAGFPFLFF